MDRILDGIYIRKRWILLGLIPLLSLLLHLPVLNRDVMGVHVWRQAETMNNVVNFAEGDANILNPKVNDLEHWGEGGLKRMEFPLMQWVFSLFYRLLGQEIWIIRLLCFLIGLGAVWGMSRLAGTLFQTKGAGVWAAWTFAWSPVFFYYMVNPLPDLLALTASIWALAFFVEWRREPRDGKLWLSAGFLALATLAKLPFVLFYGLAFFWIIGWMWRTKLGDFKKLLRLASPFLVSTIPWVAWYLWVIPGWAGNGVVAGILDASWEDLPEILDIFFTHLFSLLPELFLNYGSVLFFLAGFWFMVRKKVGKRGLFLPMLGWGALVICYFLFEINMIGKAHDYYMFPFLPGLFLIVTFGAIHLFRVQRKGLREFALLAMCLLPLMAWIRVQTRWDLNKPSLNKDLIAYREELKAATPADAICLLGNDQTGHVMYYYLGRKGFHFQKDSLRVVDLQRYMREGAEFMYSDSRSIEQQEGIKQRLSGPLIERGSIRLWRLKNP